MMIDNERVRIHIPFTNGYVYNERLYFSALAFNGMFSASVLDYSVVFHGYIPSCALYKPAAYCHTGVGYRSKIIFPPSNVGSILVYQADFNRLSTISIDDRDMDEAFPTECIMQYDNLAVIFPQNMYDGIWKIDLTTFILKRYYEIEQLLRDLSIKRITKYRDKSILILTRRNEIYCFDMHAMKLNKIAELDASWNIMCIRYHKDRCWIILENSFNIYMIENSNLVCFTLEENPEWIGGDMIPYSDFVFAYNEVFVLNYRMYHIMKLDLKNHKIVKAFSYPEGFHFYRSYFNISFPAVGSATVFGNEIIFHPLLGNMMLVYDISTGRVTGRELTISSLDFPFLKDFSMLNRDGIWYELDEPVNLDKMLSYVLDPNNKVSKRQDKAQAGEVIYRTIMEKIS